MSQLIQRHQRSHSDSSSTDYQGVQTKRLQSFINLVQDLYQQDTFRDVEKVAKEMAETTKKVQQQEESLAKLQIQLQEEKTRSGDKIQLMHEEFGRFKHEFLKTHREEVSMKDNEIKDAQDSLKNARSALAQHDATVLELVKTKADLEKQGEKVKNLQQEVGDLMQTVKLKEETIQLDKDKMAADEANIKTLENGGTQLRRELRAKEAQAEKFKSELLALRKFPSALDDDDNSKVYADCSWAPLY